MRSSEHLHQDPRRRRGVKARGSRRPGPAARAAASGSHAGVWTGLAFVLLQGAASAAEEPGAIKAVPGGVLEALVFYAVAGSTVASGLGVCVAKNIVRMAVWLFIALGSVAMLYFLLAANFLAAIQLIVYVGGTLVLLIFGVMLTSKSLSVRFNTPKLELFAATVVCGALVVCLCIVFARTTWSGAERVVPGATVAALGERLLTAYLVPFEVAGVLLMIVMVGAAHLARQEE